MNTDAHEPTLVVGATGKTGRRVVERLRARGLPVREGSRRGEPPFDWDDRATWAPALRGVDGRVHLLLTPTWRCPGAATAIGAFVGQALEQGVRRLVLLSGRGEEEAAACRAGPTGRRRRLDDRALQLVQPELQRELLARRRARRRARAAGRRGSGAVRGRRGHRRRCDGRAHRGRARRTALRADRAEAADVRRGGRRDRSRRPAAPCGSCRCRSSSSQPR